MFKATIALMAAGLSAATVIPDIDSRGSSTNAAKACSQLKAAFPNNYIDSSSSKYQSEVEINWSTNCELPAACFFTPTNTEMVARGLSIVTKAGSQFAVRNGGHNPNVKFASVDGNGVLFDLSQMRSLTLSSDNSLIYAGTGNKGGDIQALADTVNKSGVTGLNTGVGISGLTLGGGYTLFSQLNGLVTDNIANFELVLGNSTVVHANATSNTDLYRALRGGGNNFGIVTRFDMRTSPIHRIWYTLFTFAPTDYMKFMPALAQVQANMESDPKANIYMLASATEVEVALFYAEPAGQKPSPFAPLLDLTPLDVAVPPTNGTVYALAMAMSPPEPAVVRVIKSVITRPSGEYYVDLYKQILAQAPPPSNNNNNSSSSEESDLNLVLAIKPIGSRVPVIGTQRASGIPNSLNIPATPQTWTSILVQYKQDKDKRTMEKISDNMYDWMVGNAMKQGLLLPNLFANDAGQGQNVMASYGAESLERLKRVSARYDQGQVFQKLQAGGWLVSKV